MKYLYVGKNSKGETQNGSLDAPNEGVAAKILQDQKLFVLSLKPEGAKSFSGSQPLNISLSIPILGKRVSLKDKIIFTQQLAMMIKSGLPLVDAFTALEEQTENKYFSGVIKDIKEEVRGGKALSLALGKYPNIFSKLYLATVSSGEKSGKLDDILARLAEELEKDYDLITKIKNAATYPILIICALIGIVILMLLFVIPQIKKIFVDMGVQLPLVTRIVLGTSDILINFWYLFLIGIIGLTIGIRYYAKTEKGGLFWDNLKIKIPLVGKVIQKVYIARLCRTAGMLVASGLPILDIIKTSSEVINNKIYRNALNRVRDKIENGQTFSEALKQEKIFPAMLYHLVYVGEKSGKLDDILLSMAAFFDKEVEASTDNLANLVEPMMIIFVGAGVGLIVASVIMPIYSLVNVI